MAWITYQVTKMAIKIEKISVFLFDSTKPGLE